MLRDSQEWTAAPEVFVPDMLDFPVSYSTVSLQSLPDWNPTHPCPGLSKVICHITLLLFCIRQCGVKMHPEQESSCGRGPDCSDEANMSKYPDLTAWFCTYLKVFLTQQRLRATLAKFKLKNSLVGKWYAFPSPLCGIQLFVTLWLSDSFGSLEYTSAVGMI